MLSSLHALSHLILSMIFKKGVFLLIPFYNWVNPSLTRLSRSSKITQAHVHTHTHTHTHPVYCQDANWRNLMLRMCSSPPQWCLGETSVGWSLPRSCVNTQGCWYGWLLCTPLPGTHSFRFQSFQGLNIWATEEPLSGAWTGSGGANVWPLSPFNSSKKWPFPRKHRLPQPNWETWAEPCFALRDRVILLKDKRNNTNYCVDGRVNLRTFALRGSCVTSKLHCRGTQPWGWDDEPRYYLF